MGVGEVRVMVRVRMWMKVRARARMWMKVRVGARPSRLTLTLLETRTLPLALTIACNNTSYSSVMLASEVSQYTGIREG